MEQDAYYWVEMYNNDTAQQIYTTEKLLNFGKTLELFNLLADYGESVGFELMINLVQVINGCTQILKTKIIPLEEGDE